MRINFTLPVLVMSMFIVCASCSKDEAVISANPNPSVSATQVINATINSENKYELPLTSPDVQIHKQASHFSLSSIGVDSKNGMTIYQYLPAKGFTGTDEVTLKDTKTYLSYSNGGGCNRDDMSSQSVTKTSFITIKFSVAN